jgi:hypothetical protein
MQPQRHVITMTGTSPCESGRNADGAAHMTSPTSAPVARRSQAGGAGARRLRA